MEWFEARSYKDGIDFNVREKGTYVIAKREKNGQITVTLSNHPRSVEESKYKSIFALIMAIFFTLTISAFRIRDEKAMYMWLIAFVWIMSILYTVLSNNFAKPRSVLRYHAAEHMALNFYDRYKRAPDSLREIKLMSMINVSCGSTVYVVLLFFITLAMVGIIYVPFVVLKILWMAISASLSVYLWGLGKLDFIQKMNLMRPTDQELEVALAGIQEYERLKKQKEKEP